MSEYTGLEITDPFFEQYTAAVEAIHQEFSERLVATTDGIVVSLETGENANRTPDEERWPITLSVTVPTEHITLNKGETFGYLYEDTDVPESFREELVDTLYESINLHQFTEIPNPDPAKIRLYISEQGPATVTYDKTVKVPLDEVIPEDEAVYEVVHRTTDSTKVRVTTDTGEDAESIDDVSESEIIRDAEYNAEDGFSERAQFEEVIAVREVESLRKEREQAYESKNPLLATSNGDGRGLQTGDMFSVGGRTLIAANTDMGFNFTMFDAETGEWVMQIYDSDNFAHYEHDPAEWEYLGTINDDYQEKLRVTADPTDTIAGFDV